MNAIQKLNALYAHEINFSLSTFWDAGFEWGLGDPMNGWKDEGTGKTLASAIEGIWLAARRHYPKAKCFDPSWKPHAHAKDGNGVPYEKKRGAVAEFRAYSNQAGKTEYARKRDDRR